MRLLAQHPDWELEAFDISTAFLQGLKFSEIHEKARQLGIEVREHRQAWLRPPANVWRHLRALGFCTVLDCDRSVEGYVWFGRWSIVVSTGVLTFLTFFTEFLSEQQRR